MAAGRSLWSRRRRADEEGDDEEVSVMVDSHSEGTALSDLGDDEAAASSVGEPNAVEAEEAAANGGAATGRKNRKRTAEKQAPVVVSSQPQFGNMTDTEAMMNGLSIDHGPDQEMVDFDSMHHNGSAGPAPTIQAATAERKTDSPAVLHRKEHEEYRRKRDTDPAFIPNRGNFFMHDTRTHNGAGNPAMRGAWNGRSRGRGGATAGASSLEPAAQKPTPERSAELPWKHDLHETINEEPASGRPAEVLQDQQESARLFSKVGASSQSHQQIQPTKRSFSSTTLVGKVQIRVYLPGMKAPITFSEVPWKHYTRLPDHRPPLRRDKPVRVSLPLHVQRYIFPSPERSFIFIPRQMRPNQQGFGGRYQRSIGGYGYSSRRTSMYGGSMYAASVAASRRSSFASVARENAFSPVGSYVGGIPPTRPVVRLPHGSQSYFSTTGTPMGPLSGHQTPTGMGMHTYPLPAQPQYQGTPTTTVHQPKPQKAISVTGIESPAVLQQAAPPQESQPFANQLPAHLNGQSQFQPPAYFSPRQSFSYPQQPQSGTPLSGIPEQMNAPAFQPQIMPYPPGPYYPPYQQQQQQQSYYYPPGPGSYPSMPMYMPPAQNYMISPPAPAMPPQQSTPQQHSTQPAENEQQQAASQSQSQSGMVAHESNGMVFYLPASEAQQQNQGETYQPAEGFVPSYAMPGLPPPTPAPEAAYYYPPQMPMSGYYPAQAPQQ